MDPYEFLTRMLNTHEFLTRMLSALVMDAARIKSIMHGAV